MGEGGKGADLFLGCHQVPVVAAVSECGEGLWACGCVWGALSIYSPHKLSKTSTRHKFSDTDQTTVSVKPENVSCCS